MIRSAVATITLITIVLLLGCKHEATPEETTLTVIGNPAPVFSVTTLDGEIFDLSEQRGTVVLVNFWATWCPPCREEIPHLEAEVWQRFKDRGLTMIAISREENEETVRPFVDANSMSFPVAIDPDRGIFGQYAESFIPRNIVIGKNGEVLFQSSGYDAEEFAQMIERIEQAL